MGFAVMLVKGFCCLDVFLKNNHHLHAHSHSLSITHEVGVSSPVPTESLQREGPF